MNKALRYKCIGYGIILLIAYIFQSMAHSPIAAMGYTPNLMLLLTLAVAYRESETFAAFYGLSAGILYDVITNETVGLCAVFFMFLGFFMSIALQTIFRRLFLTYLFVALGALCIFYLFNYLFYILLHGSIPFWSTLRYVCLPQILLGGIWAYPAFYVIYRYEVSLKRRGIV